jgi:hypothetical protein
MANKVMYRAIAKNILLSLGLNINQTNTAELKGVTVSESLEVKNGREKIFVINFYNWTSRVLLNGNHVHISEFVSTHLRDILQTLDHNKNFEQVNAKIREYCQSFLDIGKQEEESKNRTIISVQRRYYRYKIVIYLVRTLTM